VQTDDDDYVEGTAARWSDPPSWPAGRDRLRPGHVGVDGQEHRPRWRARV